MDGQPSYADLALTIFFLVASIALPWVVRVVVAYLKEQQLQSQAARLIGDALIVARAADQLFKSGQLDKNERLNYAMRQLKQTFPGVDEQSLRTAIEAAVGTLDLIDRELTAQ